MNFNELRAKAKAMNINTKGMKAVDIEAAIAAATPAVIVEETKTETATAETAEEKKQLGRKIDPTSARQLRLAARAAGLFKKGRPIIEGSPRQLRLAAMEAKKASGVEIKRGRPKMEKKELLVELTEQPVVVPAEETVATV